MEWKSKRISFWCWFNIWKRIFKSKKNGKVKEYKYNGKLIFEDEYLNGKRNGKGKEYNKYGKLIFEGEYLNRKRNGIFKWHLSSKYI